MIDIAFLGVAVITVATAILALEAREIVYGAVALGLSFLGIAGMFILLDASFIAVFQIIVYVGAIAVLILFTVMLVRRERWLRIKAGRLRWLGVIGGLGLMLAMGLIALYSIPYYDSGVWTQAPGPSVPFTQIGEQLISEYWPALEVLAVILAASILGALTLVKVEREGG